MTRSQFNKLLLKSNDICGFNDIFGYSRVVSHYDKNEDRTALYCIHYEDQGDGYRPETIETLAKFQGRRILTFAPIERIKED